MHEAIAQCLVQSSSPTAVHAAYLKAPQQVEQAAIASQRAISQQRGHRLSHPVVQPKHVPTWSGPNVCQGRLELSCGSLLCQQSWHSGQLCVLGPDHCAYRTWC